MNGSQDSLFTASRVSGLEADSGRSFAFGVLGRLRQEVLSAVERLGRVQPAADVLAQLAHLAQVAAVHVRRVNERRDLVRKDDFIYDNFAMLNCVVKLFYITCSPIWLPLFSIFFQCDSNKF